MKTVLAIVTKGLVCRNFLRSGVLTHLLADQEMRVVLVLPRNVSPEFCRDFDHPRVVIEKVPMMSHGWFRGYLFTPFTRNLLFTRTRRLLLRYGSGKIKRTSFFLYALTWMVYAPLSHLSWLKRLTEWIEMHAFPDNEVASLFDTYQPSLVVALSLLSKEDVAFLKQAKRRGIPTLAMPKGWDTLDRYHFEVKPDHLALQNPCMVRFGERYHGYDRSKLHLIGFPIFDFSVKPEYLWPRERLCAAFGLDPSRPYIVYGSEGVWSRDELPVVEKIVEWVQSERFGKISLVIRPYFGFIKTHPFRGMAGLPHVAIDDEHRLQPFFPDGWDPTEEETVRLANLMRHAAVVICVRSTLSLDAAVVDRPVINVGYHAYIDDRGVDSTERFYEMDFYQDVLRSDGVAFVKNEDELAIAIQDALTHPEHRAEGRARLRDELCYRTDGKAAERFATLISELASGGRERSATVDDHDFR